MKTITLNLEDDEIAVAVEGYEGRYVVTTYGRIFSWLSGKFLKGRFSGNGYLQVHLCDGHTVNDFQVHRLVAQAFLPDWNPELCVDHINGCRSDNRICNLRMCTNKENSNFELARENKKLAMRNSNSCMRSKAVICCETGEFFFSARHAALSLGKRRGGSGFISQCCRGIRPSAYGYHWRYASEEEIQAHS